METQDKSPNSDAVRGKNNFVFGLIFFLGISIFGLAPAAQETGALTRLSQILFQSKETHGSKQVSKMLADRPMMAAYTTRSGKQQVLSPQDEIWQWAANAYGMTINGASIVWDDSTILDKPLSYVADHDIPSPGSQGAIRLRTHTQLYDGTLRPLGFEELWNACIFELINIRKAQRFLVAHTRALKGEINRAEYVRFCKETEYISLTELNRFYKDVWKPWAERHDMPTTEAFWDQDLPPSYEGWIALYKGSTAYRYWEEFYDRAILPNLDTQ